MGCTFSCEELARSSGSPEVTVVLDSTSKTRDIVPAVKEKKNSEKFSVSKFSFQANKSSMFLRAQNRMFQGMTEGDESKWQGNYEFICFGDTQIGMGEQKLEEEFCRNAVKFINGRKPRVRFVVVCGDHTHNLEGIWSKGDTETGRKKRIEELKAYKSIFSKLDKDIPLVCVCGNHDVGNRPTNETIKLYTQEFGDSYFSFWCGGVKFIAVNSQIIQGLEKTDELSIAHEEWLNRELSGNCQTQPVHLVAMCHIPPFCWDIKEKHTNFNWPKEKREMWLDRMVEANVKKVYCAHYHRRSGGKYRGLEVVVSAALGTHILTKPTPKELLGSAIEEFNFKLGYEGFGGTETKKETSGLQVVTVARAGLAEKWLNMAEITEEITQMEMSI